MHDVRDERYGTRAAIALSFITHIGLDADGDRQQGARPTRQVQQRHIRLRQTDPPPGPSDRCRTCPRRPPCARAVFDGQFTHRQTRLQTSHRDPPASDRPASVRQTRPSKTNPPASDRPACVRQTRQRQTDPPASDRPACVRQSHASFMSRLSMGDLSSIW